MTTNKLVWIDLETTGLDPKTDKILEIGIVVTDFDSIILGERCISINWPNVDLANMNEWCFNQHTKSGLIDECRKSSWLLPHAERDCIRFIEEMNAAGSPLAGSTISFDRSFLKEHMPKLLDLLHYRNVDVSSIKTLAEKWYPELSKTQKSDKHRSLPDLYDSIYLLKYYRTHVFK